MLTRTIALGLLIAAASPAASEPPTFERRVVAILNAGGSPETVQGRLDQVGNGLALSPDQRVAIDAVRTLVRGKTRPKGPSLADAEAFAARNPNSPASAFLLAEAALANDQPQRSADTLIAAAGPAGSLVELVSPAAVSKLTSELDKTADKPRTAALAKALLGAGWSRGSASLRSFLALAAIRDDLAAGNIDGARRFLAAVASPASLHLILIDNRLAPLREDALVKGGPRLERAWREFMAKSRDDWFERGDALSAVAYVEALKQANQYDRLVEMFQGRFTRGYNCPSDLVARSIAPDLVDALAKSGRWSRAEDVIRRSGGISPVVYGSMLLERGEFGRAGALFDRSLKAAPAPEDQDDAKAIAWLQAADDCAAAGNGHIAGSRFDPKLLDVAARMFVLLCTNREAEARNALLAALEDEDERADALRWMQPFADPQVQSDFRKQMSARIRSLQGDPAVRAAVARYGVVLDWPLTAAVPPPALAASGKAGAAWQCGDEANWRAATGPESARPPNSQ